MGFRSYRFRQALGGRRILGVALAVGGLTILLYATPAWVLYASIGIALMGVGWLLFARKIG